jgi:hypothetical protein
MELVGVMPTVHGELLYVVVLLLYPYHPHPSLDHCSTLDLDHLVQFLLHDYLDQDLVWVE